MSITQTHSIKQPSTWQSELKSLITCSHTLLTQLNLNPAMLPTSFDTNFPLRVSQSYVARMNKGDPTDPLLLQIFPTKKESQLTVGYEKDPLKEAQANPLPGLLHKFKSRVLLTVTRACPVHCRYCFRRFFPYSDNQISTQEWKNILAYIQADKNLFEVILSGGDPLMISDQRLGDYIADIEKISHVKVLRIHTRFPILIPKRITKTLAEQLSKTRLETIMVYHTNHPQELSKEIKRGVELLLEHKIKVLNQTVLLKGINDSEKVLLDLSWKLMQTGILPYYVHLLDKVQGTAHFDIDITKAKQLQQILTETLPGYLVPKFVREIPGALSKISI